jgi:hypothetical protein
MKLSRLLHVTLLFFILASFSAKAQTALDSKSVEDKFQHIRERADDFNELKWYMYKLKGQVLDTLTELKSEIIDLNRTIVSRNKKIDSLTSSNSNLQAQLKTAIDEKNSLLFLGIPMTKSSYNILLWSIIFILALVVVLAFILFKRAHLVTAHTKKDLDELKMQFEAFRKRALEREEGIVRKYHNELSKYKTKTGNLAK